VTEPKIGTITSSDTSEGFWVSSVAFDGNDIWVANDPISYYLQGSFSEFNVADGDYVRTITNG
jgi:hypothetical protein